MAEQGIPGSTAISQRALLVCWLTFKHFTVRRLTLLPGVCLGRSRFIVRILLVSPLRSTDRPPPYLLGRCGCLDGMVDDTRNRYHLASVSERFVLHGFRGVLHCSLKRQRDPCSFGGVHLKDKIMSTCCPCHLLTVLLDFMEHQALIPHLL